MIKRKYVEIHYNDKEAAKKLGCRWDPTEGSWYYLPEITHKDTVLLIKELEDRFDGYDDPYDMVDEGDGYDCYKD